MKKSIFAALCFFALNSADAQTNDFKWRFGINTGISNYSGDLNRDIDENRFDKIKDFTEANEEFLEEYSRGMIGIELERRLTQRIGLRLGANVGQVAGSDRFIGNNQFDRSLNFEADIVDANAVLKFSIFKRRSFINFYMLGGAGITLFDVNADLKDENGDFYDYSNPNVELDGDFETNVTELELQREYDQAILHIPVGLGLRLKLLPRITASLELESRFMFSDYLDNVSDAGPGQTLTDETSIVAYNPNSAYENELRGNADDELYDNYYVARVGLSYNFGRLKNAEPSKRELRAKSRLNNAGNRIKNTGGKVKDAIPSRRNKFRAPVFYPSSTPSSLHTDADASIDGGKAAEAAAKVAEEIKALEIQTIEVVDPTTGEVIVKEIPAEVSAETMAVIDEALAIVDETIAIVDQTMAEQAAIEAEIADMETQIAALETGLASEDAASDEEKLALIAEIERLETEVDAALEEQAAYIAEMEAAQEEAIQMLEIANAQIDAAQAQAVEQQATEMQAIEEAVEEAVQEEVEVVEEKEEKKKSRKERKKDRKNKKAEKEAANSEEVIEVEVIVEDADLEDEEVKVFIDDTNGTQKDVQIWVEDDGREYRIEKEIIIEDDNRSARGGQRGHGQHGGAMKSEMHAMQQEIDRLRAEKQEMQMNQIQGELDDIKNTLNLLLQTCLQSCSTNAMGENMSCDSKCTKPEDCSKDCCAGEGTEMKVEKKVMILKDADDIEKLMEENPELKDALEGIDIEQLMDDEKKNDGLNQNGSSSIDNSSNSTSSASGTTSSSTKTTTTTTTTTPQENTNSSGTTSSYNFPKNETGRTKYDYTQMEQIANYDVSHTVQSYSISEPKVRETLQKISDEVRSVGGVVLIRANTTEYEKEKMRNVVFEINKDFIYNFNLAPEQIDSSVHIAADGVTGVREVFINNSRIELLIFR